MKRTKIYIHSLCIALTVFLLTACSSGTDKGVARETSEETIADMVNVDEITECEKIITDSSLMDGKGEKAWRRVNDRMIRIKIGEKYYLRMTDADGSITSVTYEYENE